MTRWGSGRNAAIASRPILTRCGNGVPEMINQLIDQECGEEGLQHARQVLKDPKKLRVQTLTYKTVGGLEIKADVRRSEDDVPRPAAMWMHGGALKVGNREWHDGHIKNPLLRSGCVFVSRRASSPRRSIAYRPIATRRVRSGRPANGFSSAATANGWSTARSHALSLCFEVPHAPMLLRDESS
jgi:hypothetical protein